ncbi:MAG: FadR family transcriptional regulator [Thermomicrobiales bacterium]|nr:FadR family transcriptional regulator [Thermomicrobiales bacterium]
MDFEQVEVTSRADQVMRILMARISDELSPGDSLPSEAELRRQLGVSRSTVREVLRRLEARGLIVTRHGVGIQVVDNTRQVATDSLRLMLSRSDVGPQEMLEVRLVLECQAAALAAQRATTEDKEHISRAIDALEGPTMANDENIQADLDFHLAVAEASKNRLLIALTHTIRDLLRETIAATYMLDPIVERRRQDHTSVLDGIKQQNPLIAEQAMRLHLRKSEELFLRHATETRHGAA